MKKLVTIVVMAGMKTPHPQATDAPSRGIKFPISALFLILMLTASTAIAAPVTVGNHSFETEGSRPPGIHNDWATLPASGAWGFGSTGLYDILQLDIEGTHFPSYTPPAGNNVLNLSAVTPLSQDLSYAVNEGDVIALDFLVGNSTIQTPGNVNATITLGGTPYTQTVTNNAADGDFTNKRVHWIAPSSGNLGIEFSNNGGANYIDDVRVDVSTGPTIRGDVNVTNWGSAFYTDTDWGNYPAPLYPPTTNGSGTVENSLPDSNSDYDAYADISSGSQTSGGSVDYVDATSESDIGAPIDYYVWDDTWGWLIGSRTYGDGTASASLDVDLDGAADGTSAGGVVRGGIKGTSFDGSDPGGGNGSVDFTVDFTIDALAAGDVDGRFGVQVDVWNANIDPEDLVANSTPYVTGTGIAGTELMTFEQKIDASGDAWTFAIDAAEIAAAGGSVDGVYTAHFSFTPPDDSATSNSFMVSIHAFAEGEGEVVPEPATMSLLALGGLVMLRRRRRA